MLLRSETVEQAIEGEAKGTFRKDVLMVERKGHDGTAPLAMVRKRRADGDTRGTVLLVHGFGQNRYTWHTSRRSFANHLAAAGFDVFNVDLRGHGRSRRLGASLPYAMDAYVADLPAFVDEALSLSGHADAFFVGHSMGGLISLAACATTLRDKTRGIVTIGSPYRFGRGSKTLAAVTALAMAARSTGLLDRSPRVPMRVIGRHFAKRRALWDLPFLPMPIRAWRPGAMEREMLDEYLALAFDAATMAVALHILKNGSESALVSQDMSRDWGTAFELLDRPLLVVAGTHDMLAPPESVKPMYDRSRAHDKTYREFALGHIDIVMGRDAPHTVWPLVTQWLNFARGEHVKDPDEAALAVVTEEAPLSERVAEKAVDHFLPNATPEARELATKALAPWAEKLVRVLDDAIRIPGTQFGVGLDALVGMVIPGAGDLMTSIGSLSLLFLALREKVPTVIIMRMVMNILIDTVGGVVPIVGDVFDVFWKSNRKNLELIKKYRNDPTAKPSTADYALVTVGALLSIAGFVIPVVLFFVFGTGALVGLGALFSSCGGSPPPAH